VTNQETESRRVTGLGQMRTHLRNKGTIRWSNWDSPGGSRKLKTGSIRWGVDKSQIIWVVLFQPPYRREAPTGGTPLYQKQFGVFLQIFDILRKKGEINFKRGGIGSVFVFVLQSLKVRNLINEKGSYD
jgi:hypothetical protein